MGTKTHVTIRDENGMVARWPCHIRPLADSRYPSLEERCDVRGDDEAWAALIVDSAWIHDIIKSYFWLIHECDDDEDAAKQLIAIRKRIRETTELDALRRTP